MNADDQLAPHLRPGEHLVWNAMASAARMRSARMRMQALCALSAAGACLLALFFAYRFLQSVGAYASSDIAASLTTPLYGVFSIVMAALTLGSASRLTLKPAGANLFAITNLRLFSLDPQGRMSDEIFADDIEDVVAGGRASAPDIYVVRRNDPDERRSFVLEYLDRPLEAKAIIEETFLPLRTGG